MKKFALIFNIIPITLGVVLIIAASKYSIDCTIKYSINYITLSLGILDLFFQIGVAGLVMCLGFDFIIDSINEIRGKEAQK